MDLLSTNDIITTATIYYVCYTWWWKLCWHRGAVAPHPPNCPSFPSVKCERGENIGHLRTPNKVVCIYGIWDMTQVVTIVVRDEIAYDKF